MTTNASLALVNINPDPNHTPAVPKLGFVVAYPRQGIETIVRGEAKRLRNYGASCLTLDLRIDQLVTELYRIIDDDDENLDDIEDSTQLETRALNLAQWAKCMQASLKIYPDDRYGILVDAWDSETGAGAMYAHRAPIQAQEPSPIVRPH